MNKSGTKSNADSFSSIEERFNIVVPVEDAGDIGQPTPNTKNDGHPPDHTARLGS